MHKYTKTNTQLSDENQALLVIILRVTHHFGVVDSLNIDFTILLLDILYSLAGDKLFGTSGPK